MGGYWYVDSQPYSAVLDALIAASNSSQIVLTTGTYSDPGFIASLAASKITGTLAKSQQHAQTAYLDVAQSFTAKPTFTVGTDFTTGFRVFDGTSWGSFYGSDGTLETDFNIEVDGSLIADDLYVARINDIAIGTYARKDEANTWAQAQTVNGTVTINKTGSNGLVVNNTVGNALAVFNASSASVTDNSYLTIQTAGVDRWYVGQSVSALTGDFEIYGTGFGGSMLTLNRTTGAMTANAATFNGTVTGTYGLTVNNPGLGSANIYSVKQSGDTTAHMRLVRTGVQGWHVYQASAGLEFQEDAVSGAGLALISGGGISTNGPVTIAKSTGTSLTLSTAAVAGSDASPKNLDIDFAGFYGVNARIRARDTSADNSRTPLIFYTNDATGSGENLAERARFAHTTGNFLIGTSTDDGSSKLQVTGPVTSTATGKLGDYTVATLPSAASNTGHECNVTDSSVTTFGSIVAGGGSSRVKLYSNGTNWTVQAA